MNQKEFMNNMQFGEGIDNSPLEEELRQRYFNTGKNLQPSDSAANIKHNIKLLETLLSDLREICNKHNSHLPHGLINEVCQITDEAANLLKKAMSELFISARAYDKILKIAKTVADLDGRPIIGVEEVSEAIGYRSLDNKIWFA